MDILSSCLLTDVCTASGHPLVVAALCVPEAHPRRLWRQITAQQWGTSVNVSRTLASFAMRSEPLEVRRPDGSVDMQPAVTKYRRLAEGDGFAWLQLTPSTGMLVRVCLLRS